MESHKTLNLWLAVYGVALSVLEEHASHFLINGKSQVDFR